MVANNGADDDGSGTVAVMQIAKAFQSAKRAKWAEKHQFCFWHVTGEELSDLLTRTTFPPPLSRTTLFSSLENTVADLNIDMIGS
ncbi:M28 family peptidase [Chryseobacterium indoltheticum]|uniref:M28 family peptidase n=1 Tax=Chryseobacterium indoltheticum TaxID=254 RepID=UPI003F4980C1